MEAAWIAEYKRETDRERRLAILQREEGAHGHEEEYEIRKKLHEARYDRIKGQDVDYFIRGYVDLQALKRRVFLPGEKKRIRREIQSVKALWQFPLCEEYGETGRQALYDELYNMILFYMELCERDKMFNAILLGLGHISHEKRVDKIAEEIREMTGTIPERIGVQEELRIFTEAAADAFRAKYPSDADKISL